MEESRHRSHHEGEHLRGCGQTEAKDPELPGLPSGCELEILARLRVDRDLKARILQIYEEHPVIPANRAQDHLRGLSEKESNPHSGSRWTVQ